MPVSKNLVIDYDRKNHPLVDVARFLCAFFVILIHTKFFGTAWPTGDSLLIGILCRVAVPFFFICNGFFIFRNLDYDQLTFFALKRPLLKLIRLYIVWTLIYLPYWLFVEIRGGSDALGILKAFLLNFFWFGSYPVLWYLLATIIGVLLIYLFSKIKAKPWVILAAGGSLFFFYSLMTIYAFFFGQNPVVSDIKSFLDTYFGGDLSVWFVGLFFIGGGLCIAYYKPQLSKMRLLIVFFVAASLMVAEGVALLLNNHLSGFSHSLTMALFAFVLFVVLIAGGQNLNANTRSIRQMSGSIYFSHTAFNLAVWQLLKSMELIEKPFTMMIRFLLVSTLSCLLSFILLRLSKWKPFAWAV